MLRVLIVGDSAAAGVGAATQQDALKPSCCAACRPTSASSGDCSPTGDLDSPGLLRLLQATSASPVDVMIVSIGADDVTALTTPKRWVRWQTQLAQLIEERFSPMLLVHSAVPPMHAFTALPQPLRWFFGCWAHEVNLTRVCAGRREAPLFAYPFLSTVVDGLAADGFSSGAVGLTKPGRKASDHILGPPGRMPMCNADQPDPAVSAAPWTDSIRSSRDHIK